jgi:hypothetical protein
MLLARHWEGRHRDRLGAQSMEEIRARADIDHVVIGPAGVFTVNAKHHPDANAA